MCNCYYCADNNNNNNNNNNFSIVNNIICTIQFGHWTTTLARFFFVSGLYL